MFRETSWQSTKLRYAVDKVTVRRHESYATPLVKLRCLTIHNSHLTF